MLIYCVDGELILTVAASVKIPSWIKGMFHLTEANTINLLHRMPICRLYTYYKIEVKNKDLLNHE